MQWWLFHHKVQTNIYGCFHGCVEYNCCHFSRPRCRTEVPKHHNKSLKRRVSFHYQFKSAHCDCAGPDEKCDCARPSAITKHKLFEMGPRWHQDWPRLAKFISGATFFLFFKGLFWHISRHRRQSTLSNHFPLSNINKSPADRILQQPQAASPTGLFPPSFCTDLGMQVDVCNAVESKLVAVGSILVDVSDSQTRQLPHCEVITGDGSQFNRQQCETLAVRTQEGNRQEG